MTHPNPSEMARDAYSTRSQLARDDYAAGIAAERARVAAWLRSRGHETGRKLADDLEGKAPPR